MVSGPGPFRFLLSTFCFSPVVSSQLPSTHIGLHRVKPAELLRGVWLGPDNASGRLIYQVARRRRPGLGWTQEMFLEMSGKCGEDRIRVMLLVAGLGERRANPPDGLTNGLSGLLPSRGSAHVLSLCLLRGRLQS